MERLEFTTYEDEPVCDDDPREPEDDDDEGE
jgi:hypothetical protein